MELPSSTVTIQAQCPHSLSLSHIHTHSVLTAIFPGYPGLAGCPLNSRSPLNSASFWDRPKLSMSFFLNTIPPGLFRASSLSNSFNLPRYTTFDPVIIIFSLNLSKPSQTTLFDHQTDWFQSWEFSEFFTFLPFTQPTNSWYIHVHKKFYFPRHLPNLQPSIYSHTASKHLHFCNSIKQYKFSYSALTLLVGRHPAYKNVRYWLWWLDWSFAVKLSTPPPSSLAPTISGMETFRYTGLSRLCWKMEVERASSSSSTNQTANLRWSTRVSRPAKRAGF